MGHDLRPAHHLARRRPHHPLRKGQLPRNGDRAIPDRCLRQGFGIGGHQGQQGLRRQRKEFQQRFRLHRTARFAQEGPFEDRIRQVVPRKHHRQIAPLDLAHRGGHDDPPDRGDHLEPGAARQGADATAVLRRPRGLFRDRAPLLQRRTAEGRGTRVHQPLAAGAETRGRGALQERRTGRTAEADRVVDRPGDPARMGSLHQERHRRVAGGLRGRRLQERHRSTGGHPRRPGVRHRRRALLGGDLRRLGDGQRHGPFGDRPPERRDHRGRHHLVAQRDEHSPRLDPPPDRRRGPRSARQHAADGGDGQCRALRLVARAGAQPRTEAQFRGFVLRAGGFAPLEELHRNERDGQFDHGLRPLQLRGPARGRHHATDAQDRNLRQTRHQLGLPLARRAGPARGAADAQRLAART